MRSVLNADNLRARRPSRRFGLLAALVAAWLIAMGVGAFPADAINLLPTSTSLSVTPSPSASGEAVTLTADVESALGLGNPGGNVVFLDGSDELGVVSLSGGQATLVTSSLAPGGHSLQAKYRGSRLFGASASAVVNHQVGTAPEPGVAFGLWSAPRSDDPAVTGDPRANAILRMEDAIGRPYDIIHTFYAWSEVWPTTTEHLGCDNGGRGAFVNWKAFDRNQQPGSPPRWADITAGLYDSLIDARADDAAAFSCPLYVTFHHEPQFTEGDPLQYQAAWRYIVDRFRSRNVTNVRWTFTNTGTSFSNGNSDSWYPGDDYIDYVGVDVYNWYGTSTQPNAGWRSFEAMTEGVRQWARSHNKPVVVAETGSLEDPDDPMRRAQWIEDAQAFITQSWPELKAFLYFQGAREGWWIDTPEQALAAYRAMGADPLFGG